MMFLSVLLLLAVVFHLCICVTIETVKVKTSSESCSQTINMKFGIAYAPLIQASNCEKCRTAVDCPLMLPKECKLSFTIADEIEKVLSKICFQSGAFEVDDCFTTVTFQEKTPRSTNDLETIACHNDKYVYGSSRDICLEKGQSLDMVFSGSNLCSVKGYGRVELSRSLYDQDDLSDPNSCRSVRMYKNRDSGTVYSRHKETAPAVIKFCKVILSPFNRGHPQDFCYRFHYAKFLPGGAQLLIAYRTYGYKTRPTIDSEYCMSMLEETGIKVEIKTFCYYLNPDKCVASAQHEFVFTYRFKERQEPDFTPEVEEGYEDNSSKIVVIIVCVVVVFILICCCICCCYIRKNSSNSENGTAAAAEPLNVGSPDGGNSLPVFVHPSQSISTNSHGRAIYQTSDLSSPQRPTAPRWSATHGPSSPNEFSPTSPVPDRCPSAPPLEESEPFVDHRGPTVQADNLEMPPPAYDSLFPDNV